MRVSFRTLFSTALVAGASLTSAGVHAGPFNGWTLNGSAQLVDGDEVLRLTDALSYQAGAAWAPDKLSLTQDFSLAFSFSLAGGSAADGITLTFQNSAAGLAALGSDGGGLAYQGINKSLAFTFDTFDNGWDTDRTPGHNTSVAFDGDLVNRWGGATVGQAHELRGATLYSWVDYTAANGGVFAMYFSDTATQPAQPDHQFALSSAANLFDGDEVYVGFTGATGGATDIQRVLSFSVTSVPEPATQWLAAMGLVGLWGFRRYGKRHLPH